MSPAITERTSLLTQGLEPLAKHSAKARDLLDRLYALDDDLQDAHVRAKRDDEYGEDVVQAYRKFLALRQILIDELERLSVPVPWQMRMRIDDIELTVRACARSMSLRICSSAFLARLTEKDVNDLYVRYDTFSSSSASAKRRASSRAGRKRRRRRTRRPPHA